MTVTTLIVAACFTFLSGAVGAGPGDALPIASNSRAVTFTYRPTAKEVTGGIQSLVVVGEFNQWDASLSPMAPSGDGKTWSCTVQIAPGDYQYLFCLNHAKWFPDPKAPTIQDGNGNTNSHLVVNPPAFDEKPGKLNDGEITVSALKHLPGRAGIFKRSTGSAGVLFQTRTHDVARVFVRRVGGQLYPLTNVNSGALYDQWRGTFPISKTTEVRYDFVLEDGKTRLFFGPDGASTSPGRPFVAHLKDEPLPKEPDWISKAIFYQIFPDRFFNGDPTNDPIGVQPWGTAPTSNNFMGGDLAGIQQKLPYLRELGITALYLNPIFASETNHGYDTTDYLKVAPRFGTNEDLKNLVASAHRHGIKVVLDGVFNHSGTHFFAFQDLLKNQERSQYRNWYHVLKYPVVAAPGQQTYRTFSGVWQMPKWNHEDPEARKYLLKVATFWIKYAHIDGWRLDVADQVPHDYWKDFRNAVREANPEAYIVGEEWGNPQEYMQGDEHDATMNYPWRRAVLDFCLGKISASEFRLQLWAIRESVPEAAVAAQFNLIGSHDTRRVRFELHQDLKKVAMAMVFQMTYPGVPSIYYGDEIGLDGGSDPDDRRCFNWNSPPEQNQLYKLIHALIQLRKSHICLRRGTFTVLKADDGTGEFTYQRQYGRDHITVTVNPRTDAYAIRSTAALIQLPMQR